MSTLWNPVTPDPGDTLKGCTLVGAKRLVEAEKPVVAAGQIAAKRQRTLLLPPAATALLGETATAYHKLVEFDRRLDLTVKHHRSTIEARLRAAGVGPNGETISAFPVAPFPPLARVLRLYVEFTQDAAVDPIQHAQQPGAMPWTLRLWGVNAHNEEAGAVDLSRHFLKIHISFVGSNPPVVVDWQPQGRPTPVLSVTRLTQPCTPPPRPAPAPPPTPQPSPPTSPCARLYPRPRPLTPA